jgi:hypothetical protein
MQEVEQRRERLPREARLLFALLLIALVFLGHASRADAEPNLAVLTSLGELSVYPDDRYPNRFYYVPGALQIARSENGQPALHLLLTRYVGTQFAGDQGEWINRNILSVRFHRPELTAEQKRKARNILSSRGVINPRLVPLPLYGIEGAIQYTAVDSETVVNLPVDGVFKNSDEPLTSARTSLWTERQYSLSLGPNDAQLLLSALDQGGVLISFAYAYLAKSAQGSSGLPIELSGSPEVMDVLKERIDLAAGEDSEMISTVRADAIALSIEPEHSEFHITKMDINDRLPPGYASLDVYCFDFQQETVPGQYAKRIEIKATSPTGKTVKSFLEFARKTPEVYAQSFNIPFAVKFSEPFEYRVVSVFETGKVEEVTPWTERAEWSGVLDISHTPDEE